MVKTNTARKGTIRKDAIRKDSTRRNAVRKRAPKTTRGKGPFSSIDDAISAIRAGRMIVVVDDEDRENEGDLTMAAARVTPDAINFMARFEVMIIPFTWEHTNLSGVQVGAAVNLECDMVGKYVARAVEGFRNRW